MAGSGKGKHSAEYVILVAFSICIYLSTWVTTFLKSFDFIASLLVVAIFFVVAGVFFARKINRKEMYALYLADYVLVAMMIFDVISLAFAEDRSIAVSGISYRYEGILALFLYYELFCMSSHLKDENEKKRVFCVVAGILFFSCLIGVFSGVGLLDFIGRPKNIHVAAIPFSNQNFFGIISGMALAISLGMIIAGENKRIRILGILAYILSVMAMFSCDSMGPVTGNIMAFVLVIFMQLMMCIKKKDLKYTLRSLITILVLIGSYILILYFTNWFRGGAFDYELNRDFEGLSEGLTSDRAFTGRMRYWKAAFNELPNYWITGTGIDNFALIGRKQGLNSERYYVDKAHNEYIQIMITEGVFAALNYIVFLFVIFIKGLKEWSDYITKHKWMYLGCFILFFSYIAQAFFNVRLIYIAPYFFIMTGICYSYGKNIETSP